MEIALAEGRNGATLVLMLAATALYIACRGAIDAAARPDGSDPGRRGAAQGLPIAATAVVAILMRKPAIAITVIFSSSVAALCLALGLSSYLAPMRVAPPRSKAWAFLLPVAFLAFVAGFAGELNVIHATMLLLLGAAILPVWLERSPADFHSAHAEEATKQWSGWQIAELAVSIALAGIGAFGAVRGTVAVAAQSAQLNPAVVAAAILSPLLVLPSLGTSASVAQRGDCGPAAAALIATVLLNLCLILPLVILLQYATTYLSSGTPRNFDPLPFPSSIWRIENVILLVLGLLLLPVALGRWLLGRAESILLILGYATYLMLSALASRTP